MALIPTVDKVGLRPLPDNNLWPRLSSGKEHLLCALALAVIACVCFLPLTLHPTDLLVGVHRQGLNDVTHNILAFRSFQVESVRNHELPLWNPFALGGVPWFGNPQSAGLYPPNWVFVVFDVLRALSWVTLAHHWFAGLGTYFLARRYGCGWAAGLVGGAIFLAAPFYVATTAEGHYNPGCLIAWVPWQFLAYERLRDGKRDAVFLSALILALAFFCGHAQELLYLVLILSVLVVVDTVGKIRASDAQRGSGLTLLLRWAAVGVLTLGLVAVELIPILVYKQHCVRAGGLSAEMVSEGSLEPSSLWQLIDPFAFGGPETYHGPGTFYWEAVCHVGVIPLMLALLGVFGATRRYPTIRFAVLWLVILAFAMGDDTPLYTLMHRFVPGVSLFRAPARALYFLSFASAILAAMGTDTLARWVAAGGHSRRTKLLLGCALACFMWLSLSFPISGDESTAGLSLNIARLSSWLLLGVEVVTLGICWSRARRVVALGMIFLVTLELAVHANRVLHTVPHAAIRSRNEVLEFVKERAGKGRIIANQYVISDREAWNARIQKLQAYEPVPLERVALVGVAMCGGSLGPEQLTGFLPIELSVYHKDLVDLLGVKFACVLGTEEEEFAGWRLIKRGHVPREFPLRGSQIEPMPYRIYENLTPLPRAFVLGDVLTVDSHDDLAQCLRALNPRERLLLPQDVLPPGERQKFAPARIVEYTPRRVIVDAQLDAAGYLVLTDIFSNGWRASVDGRSVPVLPADVAFRGVALPPGNHRVEFVYQPEFVKFGGIISLTTLAMVLSVVVLGWRRRFSTRSLSDCPIETAGQE